MHTGHCPLNYLLETMGKADPGMSRFSELETETVKHTLCECEALGRRRFQHRGQTTLTPEQIKDSAPKLILRFFKNMKTMKRADKDLW